MPPSPVAAEPQATTTDDRLAVQLMSERANVRIRGRLRLALDLLSYAWAMAMAIYDPTGYNDAGNLVSGRGFCKVSHSMERSESDHFVRWRSTITW